MRQTSNAVKRNRATGDNLILGWDAMIRDARKRIEDLLFSIQVFERRKAAGEPSPAMASDIEVSEKQQ
jgi:hypothetical protein